MEITADPVEQLPATPIPASPCVANDHQGGVLAGAEMPSLWVYSMGWHRCNCGATVLRMKITAIILLALSNSALASPVPTFWSDSYDAGDGICRCDSTYDHGIATTMVQTPCGNKTVPEICDLIEEKYGAGPVGNRIYFNSIQCGYPPYNNVADETDCPGIPANTTGTWSGPRCQETGSKWPLDGICESEPVIDCGSSSWQNGALAFMAHCVDVKESKINPLAILGAIVMGIGVIVGSTEKYKTTY